LNCGPQVELLIVFPIVKSMKTPLRILLSLLFLAILTPCYATEMVRIPAQYKKGALASPDPEYPMKSQHLGYQGQGIYRLVINKKTGMADEIKVLKTTGHRELDASAVMTLLNWKFQPGTIDHRDVLIVFEMTGWARGLH
jgi:TonB family protein